MNGDSVGIVSPDCGSEECQRCRLSLELLLSLRAVGIKGLRPSFQSQG